jgi:hypothetical protein
MGIGLPFLLGRQLRSRSHWRVLLAAPLQAVSHVGHCAEWVSVLNVASLLMGSCIAVVARFSANREWK